MDRQRGKWLYPVIFAVLFVGIASYYNYFEILSKKPQSIHRWRQCEGASIAMNYYNHGMNFFKPEVFFQISDGGTAGYAVGECPILYYAVAILWKIFGHSDLIFRGLNFLIFFIGLFALFRMLQRVFKDNFWAMALPLLFFTSPVIVYYAGNYLTDTTALALSFVGWNLITKSYLEEHKRSFYLAILVFMIAGLLKIVALISVIALLIIFLLETFKKKNISGNGSLRLDLKRTIAFAVLFLTVFGWYLFAISYNNQHKAVVMDGTSYFLTGIFPIWDLSSNAIRDVIKEIVFRWLPDYFNISVLILIGICIVTTFCFIRKQDKFWGTLSILLFLGMIGFSLLWFYLFAIHDYYAINPLIMPLFFLITGLVFISKHHHKIFSSLIVKGIFFLLLLFNVHYANTKLKERYGSKNNEYNQYKDVHSIGPYLEKIGIKREDKVISLPDGTSNYTLYLMNRAGWTATNFQQDSLQIKKYMSLGAKYLILTEEEPFNWPCLEPFLSNKIGQYGRVNIFKLQ